MSAACISNVTFLYISKIIVKHAQNDEGSYTQKRIVNTFILARW